MKRWDSEGGRTKSGRRVGEARGSRMRRRRRELRGLNRKEGDEGENGGKEEETGSCA
jgi:hypothetical protein